MYAEAVESTIQTTIDVPGGLYERVAQLVRRGAAGSVDEFILEAVESRINKLGRRGLGENSWAAKGLRPAEEDADRESGRCDFDVMEEFGE